MPATRAQFKLLKNPTFSRLGPPLASLLSPSPKGLPAHRHNPGQATCHCIVVPASCCTVAAPVLLPRIVVAAPPARPSAQAPQAS